MLKVSLVGAYGYWNYGDDLLAWLFANKVREWVPDVTLIVSGPENGIDYLMKITGAEASLPLTSTKYWLKNKKTEYRKSDVVIFGGGGILYDYPSLAKYNKIDPRRASALHYLTSLLSKKRNGAAFALGIGIGPLQSKYSQLLTNKFLKKIDYLSVRDSESANYAKFYKHETQIIPDSSFILAGMVQKEIKTENKIGIVVRKWSHRNSFEDDNQLKILFEEIERKTGYIVIPISLRTGEFSDIGGRKVLEWDPIKHDPIEFGEVLAGFSVLVTMRLHAMNVAACYGVPSISIGLDPKLINSASSLGLKDYVCSPNVKNEEIVDKIELLLKDKFIRRNLKTRTLNFSKEVDKSFDKLKSEFLIRSLEQ